MRRRQLLGHARAMPVVRASPLPTLVLSDGAEPAPGAQPSPYSLGDGGA